MLRSSLITSNYARSKSWLDDRPMRAFCPRLGSRSKKNRPPEFPRFRLRDVSSLTWVSHRSDHFCHRRESIASEFNRAARISCQRTCDQPKCPGPVRNPVPASSWTRMRISNRAFDRNTRAFGSARQGAAKIAYFKAAMWTRNGA
jgi:hypothetical protein